MKKRKCYIFGSAEIKDYSCVNIDKDCYVIAADGGYRHLNFVGITPDLLLGDFDSIDCAVPNDCEILTVPAEKDDTDMMLAVKTALDKGFGNIVMYGVLGGRLDHAFANIQTLEYINSHGAEAILIDNDNEVLLLSSGEYKFFKRDGWYLSIFSYSSKAVITTTGTKYNLVDYELTSSFPLGVSNEIIDDFCKVTVYNGILLVIMSKK